MWCVYVYICVCVWCAKNARSAFLNMLFNCASINSLFHTEKCVILHLIIISIIIISTYCVYFIIYSFTVGVCCGAVHVHVRYCHTSKYENCTAIDALSSRFVLIYSAIITRAGSHLS